MKIIHLIALILISTITNAYTYSPAVPYSYVVTNSGTPHIFVMLPKDPTLGRANATGKCYKIGTDGKFLETWSLSGWYSYPGYLYLSASGEILARVININRPADDIGKMESLIFYKNGLPFKKYLVKDIINPEKVKESPFSEDYEIVNYYAGLAPVVIESSKISENKRTPKVLQIIDKRGIDGQFLLIRNRELEWLIYDMIDGSLIDRGFEPDVKNDSGK